MRKIIGSFLALVMILSFGAPVVEATKESNYVPEFEIKLETKDTYYSNWLYKKKMKQEDGRFYLPDVTDKIEEAELKGYKFKNVIQHSSMIRVIKTKVVSPEGEILEETEKEEFVPYKKDGEFNVVDTLKIQKEEKTLDNGNKEIIESRYAVAYPQNKRFTLVAMFEKDENKPFYSKNKKETMEQFDDKKDDKELVGFNINGKYTPLDKTEYTRDFEVAIKRIADIFRNKGEKIQYGSFSTQLHRRLDPCNDDYQLTNCSDFVQDLYHYLFNVTTPHWTHPYGPYARELLKLEDGQKMVDVYLTKEEIDKKIEDNTFVDYLVENLSIGDALVFRRNNDTGHAMLVVDEIKDKDGNRIDLEMYHSGGVNDRFESFDAKDVPGGKEGSIMATTLRTYTKNNSKYFMKKSDNSYLEVLTGIKFNNPTGYILNFSKESVLDKTKTKISDKVYLVKNCGDKVEPVYKEVKETKEVIEEVETPFETKRIEDENLEKGKEVVDQEGIIGKDKVTYKVTTKDGKETGREEISRETITEKQDKIVRIGTGLPKEITEVEEEKELPFETIRKENPDLHEDEENVIQEGIVGKDKVKYEVTIVDGKETERKEISREVVTEKQDEIIEVGTKPIEGTKEVTEEVEIPFEIITKENPDLYEDEENIIQEGIVGKDKVKYEIITNKGEEKERKEISRETITEKQDEIIEVGTKPIEETKEVTEEVKIPYEIVYIEDETLEKGEEIIEQEGVEGEEEVVFEVTTNKGVETNKVEVSRETITEKKDKIIRIGVGETEEEETTPLIPLVPAEEIKTDEEIVETDDETNEEAINEDFHYDNDQKDDESAGYIVEEETIDKPYDNPQMGDLSTSAFGLTSLLSALGLGFVNRKKNKED